MSAQIIAVNGTSQASSAITSTKIRFATNVAVHFAVGVSPVAYTGNCEMIPANTTRFINMEGLNNKIAVVASGATGECSIVPCGTVNQSSMNQNQTTFLNT
jgi:hypothetical protein